MRKRYVTFRLAAEEYQTLKAQAAQAGTSVPILARRLALEASDVRQIAERVDALERLIRDIPDRPMLIEIARRLGDRIDRAAGKTAGGAA